MHLLLLPILIFLAIVRASASQKDPHPKVFLARFVYQKQIRALYNANGVKVIEPAGEKSVLFLHVRRESSPSNKLSIMRTKHNLMELLKWCNDEKEALNTSNKTPRKQDLLHSSTFIPASPAAQPISPDVDLLEHNIFLMDIPPQHRQHYKPLVLMTVGFASITYHHMRERKRQQQVAKYFTCCHASEMIQYSPCDCAFKSQRMCSIPCFSQCTPYEGRSVPFKINVPLRYNIYL